jgi:hypothetical protein
MLDLIVFAIKLLHDGSAIVNNSNVASIQVMNNGTAEEIASAILEATSEPVSEVTPASENTKPEPLSEESPASEYTKPASRTDVSPASEDTKPGSATEASPLVNGHPI